MNTQDRTGLLVVRLWIEGDPFAGFRARITEKLDSTLDDQRIATASNTAAVCAVVKQWIDAFVTSN